MVNKLAISVAPRFSLPVQDLIGEGNYGLTKAINHFDYRRGFQFSTYAKWWIHQAMAQSVADNARSIRLPIELQHKLKKLNETTSELTNRLGRDPTPSEIAKAMHKPLTEILKMFRTQEIQPTSLNKPVGDDGYSEIQDMVADRSNIAELAIESMDNANLIKMFFLCNTLTLREKYLLSFRYGIIVEQLKSTHLSCSGSEIDYDDLMKYRSKHNNNHSLKTCGRIFGNFTKEGMRQMEARGLAKIQDTFSPETIKNRCQNA